MSEEPKVSEEPVIPLKKSIGESVDYSNPQKLSDAIDVGPQTSGDSDSAGGVSSGSTSSDSDSQ